MASVGCILHAERGGNQNESTSEAPHAAVEHDSRDPQSGHNDSNPGRYGDGGPNPGISSSTPKKPPSISQSDYPHPEEPRGVSLRPQGGKQPFDPRASDNDPHN
jgi:hypothetical protein